MFRILFAACRYGVIATSLLVALAGCRPEDDAPPEPKDFQEVQTSSVNCGESLRVPIPQNSEDYFVTVTTPESCTAQLDLFHRSEGDPGEPTETHSMGASSRFVLQASSFYGSVGIECLPVEEAGDDKCEVRITKKISPAGEGSFHKVAEGIRIPCRKSTRIYKAHESRITIVRVKFVSTCGGENDTAEIILRPRVEGSDPQGDPVDLTPTFIHPAPGEFFGFLPVRTTGRGFINAKCNGDGDNPCEIEISIN